MGHTGQTLVFVAGLVFPLCLLRQKDVPGHLGCPES